MAYTRQYTQGVGWENEPSINTPISAENLNQMDVAIQDVDEAAYNEFLAVYAAIAQASGGQVFSVGCSAREVTVSDKVESQLVAVTALPANPNNNDLLFLQSVVDATYGGDASYGWILTDSLQTQKSILMEAGGRYTYKSDITAGDTIVLSYDPIGSSGFSDSWRVRAVIPASGGGTGCRILSDHITSVDSNTGVYLMTSTDIFNGQDPQDGDMVFLYSEIDATFPAGVIATTWQIAFGSSGTINGGLNDFREGDSGTIWRENVSVGSILIITKIPAAISLNGWALRAVIPAAGGGGGTTVIANPSGTATDDLKKLQVGSTIYGVSGDSVYDVARIGADITPYTVYTSEEMPIELTVEGFSLIANIMIIVRLGKLSSISYTPPLSQYTEGLYFNINNTGAIPVYYNNTMVTGDSVFTFDKNALYILLLRSVTSQEEPWRFDIVRISNLSTLMELTDTNISTPADGQYLKYDSATSKWINASGGGGGGSSTLAGLDDTTISSPTAAQPLTYDDANSVWINGGVIPTANGGTGNADGYIRTGKTANTTAGERATIEGLSNSGTGKNVHVEGSSNTASANDSHAEGNGNTASGVGAHAEGTRCTASGQYSHAEGYACQATQPYAHAQGNSCVASSSAASAAGFHTTAASANQFVIGKYNDNNSTNIFEVGIGTANNAKANGLELDSSGNLKVAGTITDGNGNVLNQYFETTVTLSTSAQTTATFTDAVFTTTTCVDVAVSEWGLVPDDVTVTTGSCTVTFPSVDTARTVSVRVYVR